MANENRKTIQHVSGAIANAVVPNLFREADVAMMITLQPVAGTEKNKDGPTYHSNGPMKYSVKGIDMDTVQGKEFIIALLGYVASEVALDIVAQLEEIAKKMQEDTPQTVPPPQDVPPPPEVN
jgi:hypothetical protein